MKNSIVLVPFPFDDYSETKLRPALCLTNEIGIYQHIIIAFISSNLDSNKVDTDLIVRANLNIKTGLKIDSVIKLNKIITIPKSIIKRKLGELDIEESKIIQQKIVQLFELN